MYFLNAFVTTITKKKGAGVRRIQRMNFFYIYMVPYLCALRSVPGKACRPDIIIPILPLRTLRLKEAK